VTIRPALTALKTAEQAHRSTNASSLDPDEFQRHPPDLLNDGVM
jgi:hypothetical protein